MPAWAWASSLGVALVLLLLIALAQKPQAPRLTPSDQAGLKLSRTVYDPVLADKLTSIPEHLVTAGPLFRPSGIPANLLEFSPDLTLQGSRVLRNTFFYAAEFDRSNALTFMAGGCANPSGTWASCTSIEKLTLSTETTSNTTPELGLDFHEYEPDGSGGYWAIKYDSVPCDAKHRSNCGTDADGKPVSAVGNCHVVHVQGGQIVFDWSAYDHLPDGETRSSRYGEDNDIFHCNSIDSYQIDGLEKLLVSMRNTDSIYQIDVASGKVDWKIGGTDWPKTSLHVANLGSLGIVGKVHEASQVLSGQHDARYLGGGRVSVFDNGSATNRAARGIIFRVDQSALTSVVEKVFVDPSGAPSLCTGSFRPLAGEAFWVAGWGCSTSGITVFSADTTPIVSTTLDPQASVNLKATDAHMKPIRWTLGYRIITEK